MKNKTLFLIVNLVFITLLVISFKASSQCELYQLDLNNNATYTASCFDQINVKWRVRDDSCSLTSSAIIIPGVVGDAPNLDVPVSFDLTRTGNLEGTDFAMVEYAINGVWTTLAVYPSNTIPLSNTTYSFLLSNLPQGGVLELRVIFKTDDNTEKLDLRDGGMCAGTSLITGTSTPFITLMPVELVSFNAQVENSRIKLFWITASEKDNDYFVVERSGNGATFEKVTVVDGSGNSTQKKNYLAYDNVPIFGTSYYRLKQMDFDGTYEYSPAVSVSVNFSSSTCKFKVIPNPCTPQCNIHLQGCEEQNISVALVDVMGNEVYSNIPISEGNKSFTIDPTNNLKPGVYILTGKGNNEKPNQRVVIQ